MSDYTSSQVASCTFYQFGSAGMQVRLNALCILTLNILVDKVAKVELKNSMKMLRKSNTKNDTFNDQVYLLLWWWYLFLTTMGLLRLFQRVGLFSTNFRLFLLLLKLRLDFDASSDGELVKEFIRSSAIGDWFVLYQMSKNLNQSLFFQFLVKLAQPVGTNEERKLRFCKTKPKETVKENGGKKIEEKRWSSFVSFATSPPPVLRHDANGCEEPAWTSRRRRSSDDEEEEEPVSIS